MSRSERRLSKDSSSIGRAISILNHWHYCPAGKICREKKILICFGYLAINVRQKFPTASIASSKEEILTSYFHCNSTASISLACSLLQSLKRRALILESKWRNTINTGARSIPSLSGKSSHKWTSTWEGSRLSFQNSSCPNPRSGRNTSLRCFQITSLFALRSSPSSMPP